MENGVIELIKEIIRSKAKGEFSYSDYYTIEFLGSFSIKNLKVEASKDNLLDIIGIFETTQYIIQYKVFKDSELVTQSDLGYNEGYFKKWRIKYSFEEE